MRSVPQLEWTPFFWPSEWTDPALIELVRSGPINCLIFEREKTFDSIRRAAQHAALATIDWNNAAASGIIAGSLSSVRWDSPVPVLAVTDAVWPGIRLSGKGGRDTADAGPTRAPWVDSNRWLVQLAKARARGKEIWVVFDPPKDGFPPAEDGYVRAIADAAVCGARWPVTLDPEFSRSLAARKPDAVERWKRMGSTISFFEQRLAWNAWQPGGALGVISDFTGDHEFMAQEVLNLAARRNLLYRVIERSAAASARFEGLRAILYMDPVAPAPALQQKLLEFARNGGVLLGPPRFRLLAPRSPAVEGAVSGYEIRTVGKGRIATFKNSWDDPYQVAVDAHLLMSRRNDPVRLFNTATVGAYYSVAPDGKKAVVQLVRYSRPGGARTVIVGTAEDLRAARFWTIEQPTPVPLRPENAELGWEFPLPPFSIYAAVELER